MKYRIRVVQPVRSKLIDPDLRSPEYIVQQKDGILGWKKSAVHVPAGRHTPPEVGVGVGLRL